jgi:hypothetical protein
MIFRGSPTIPHRKRQSHGWNDAVRAALFAPVTNLQLSLGHSQETFFQVERRYFAAAFHEFSTFGL